MTTAKPPARYSAMESARAGDFATPELHHPLGHDRLKRSTRNLFSLHATCQALVELGAKNGHGVQGITNRSGATARVCWPSMLRFRIACCSCLLIGCGARAPRQHQECLQPRV